MKKKNQSLDEILFECAQHGVTDLVGKVANEHRVGIELLLSRRRTKTIAKARTELYVELHNAGLSYPEIGRCTGRDHTTVLSGVRSVRKLGVA